MNTTIAFRPSTASSPITRNLRAAIVSEWIKLRSVRSTPIFIGLAGLYDPTGAGDIAAAAALPAFFGGSATTDPDAWARGTPATWVTPESAAGLSVFLLHGVEDDALPADQSRQFADVLRAAGADVTMVDWPGGHWDVLDPATVVPPLYTWIVDPARG